MNDEQVPEIILLGYIVVQDHDESTCRREDVRIQKESIRI